MTFNFRRQYREQVVVHEKGGGGPRSFHFLERVVLSEALRSIVLERLKPLGGGYKAVHVRNTDIKTNTKQLFDRVAPLVRGQTLLVCSDDARVIDRAREEFTSSRVVSVSDIPDTNGTPLHHSEVMRDEAARRKQAIDAVVDLLALGGADAVYYASDSVYKAGETRRVMVSGFSRLAEHLSRNKYVIDGLLRRPARSGASLRWRSMMLCKRAGHSMLRATFRYQPCG